MPLQVDHDLPGFEDQVGIFALEVDTPDRVAGDAARKDEFAVGDNRAVDNRSVVIIEHVGGFAVVRRIDFGFDRVASVACARDKNKRRQHVIKQGLFHKRFVLVRMVEFFSSTASVSIHGRTGGRADPPLE